MRAALIVFRLWVERLERERARYTRTHHPDTNTRMRGRHAHAVILARTEWSSLRSLSCSCSSAHFQSPLISGISLGWQCSTYTRTRSTRIHKDVPTHLYERTHTHTHAAMNIKGGNKGTNIKHYILPKCCCCSCQLTQQWFTARGERHTCTAHKCITDTH